MIVPNLIKVPEPPKEGSRVMLRKQLDQEIAELAEKKGVKIDYSYSQMAVSKQMYPLKEVNKDQQS